MMRTVFQSHDLPAEERFDAWVAMADTSYSPTRISSKSDTDFRASLAVMDLGAVALSQMTCASLESRRDPKLIRQGDPEQFHLSLGLGGRMGITQAHRDTSLAAYDLTVYDTSRPFRAWTVEEWNTALVVHVPHALLPLPRSLTERFIATQLPGEEGLGALLTQFLVRLASDTVDYRPDTAARLGLVLTDLLTMLLAHHANADAHVPPETRQTALTHQIQTFIQTHLADPGMTPDAIAAAHHISTRYLHRLFQQQGLTVSAWIRHLRLERCRRDLANPRLCPVPVHVIGARWGFPQPSDFSRAFRTAYGLPPRDFRQCTQRSETLRSMRTTPQRDVSTLMTQGVAEHKARDSKSS